MGNDTFIYNSRNEHIGNIIKNCRKRDRVTQSWIAETIGCSNAAVSTWENGKFPIPSKFIQPLCDLFRLEIIDLTPMNKWHGVAESKKPTEEVEPRYKAPNRTNTQTDETPRYYTSSKVDPVALGKALEAQNTSSDPEPKSILKVLGYKITQFRKLANFTQYKLAKKVGVSQSLICSWEKDKVQVPEDKVSPLCRALNIQNMQELMC